MKVFQFIDAETHFFAARDESEARACYRATYEDEIDTEDLSVKEIPREKWKSIPVRDDDVPGGRTTVEAIVGGDVERDAYLICSTVW